MHIWSGVKNLNQKLPILHVPEGNLTGFNIFTIFIDAVNENENLKEKLNKAEKKVEELESKIFLFF